MLAHSARFEIYADYVLCLVKDSFGYYCAKELATKFVNPLPSSLQSVSRRARFNQFTDRTAKMVVGIEPLFSVAHSRGLPLLPYFSPSAWIFRTPQTMRFKNGKATWRKNREIVNSPDEDMKVASANCI